MTMILKFLWSIIGLSAVVLANGRVRHQVKAEEEVSAAPATTEAPQVNVSSTLSNYDGLNLLQHVKHKTIGFVNVTENVGLSITVQDKCNIKILLDSKTGRALHFAQSDKIKLIQNNEFRGDILKALDLILQNYVFKDEPISGNSTDVESTSEDAKSLWSDVYLHLGHPKEKGNRDFRSIKHLETFSKRLKRLYFGSLKGLIVGNGPFPLKQNLNRFLTISLGLHELFSKATGGLKAILAKNVSFEVNSLFNAKNGAEVFVYVLRQTGSKFDLSTIWSGLLNNVEDHLEIIGKLGGGESKNGVDETFALIAHFWGALRLRIPPTDFIQFLFQSATEDHWSQADDGDLQQVLKDVKNITDEQSKKYDSVFKTSGFVKFFTNLTVNSVIENNVNISELVEKWRKRDAIGGLKVISHLSLKIFSPEKYSNLLFDGFTAFLNATSDPEAVKNLIPGVPLGNTSGKGESIWNSVSKSYNIEEQLKKGGNPNEILNGVPVFGEFSKIYQDSIGKNFDFTKILNGGSLNEYLSKNPFANPIKLGVDGFSNFFKESGNIIKHIFVDPIQHFLPIPLLPKGPGLPNLPFLPPGSIPFLPTEKNADEKATRPPGKAVDDDDNEEKVTTGSATSKKSSDEGEEKETESSKKEKETESTKKEKPSTSSLESDSPEKPTASSSEPESSEKLTAPSGEPESSEKPTASSSESESSEKPTTSASEATHLTGSVSTTPCDDDSKATKTKDDESSGKTTEKCDDCEDKESKPSTLVKEEGSSSASTEGSIEFKHHHIRHHAEHRHHGHHSSREHHKQRHGDKEPIAHKYKHHHTAKGHENKHNNKKHQSHQDKHHHEKNHHDSRRHNHGAHQDKHHERNHKHSTHELKHHQKVQHDERHHHKQAEIQR